MTPNSFEYEYLLRYIHDMIIMLYLRKILLKIDQKLQLALVVYMLERFDKLQLKYLTMNIITTILNLYNRD